MGVARNDTVQKLFRGGSLLFLGLVVELGISFLAKVVIARTLGPVDYGAVSLGVTIVSVFSMVSLFGLPTGIARFLPRFDTDADRQGAVVSAFQLAVPVAVVTGLFIALFADAIAVAVFHKPAIAPYVLIFGAAIPFAAVMRISIGVIQGTQLDVPKVIVENVTPPLTRFTAVIIAVVVGAGALGIAIAYALAYVVAALVGLYYVVRWIPLQSAVSSTRMHGRLLAFSAPLSVSISMAFVLTYLDTFMLGYFSTIGGVGIYNVVYPLAQLVTVPLTAFGFLFLPILSELDSRSATDEMHRLYQLTTRWVFLATVPVFILLAVFPDQTIALTFGREYLAGGLTLAVLAVAFFSHAVAGPNYSLLVSIGRTRLLMWNNLIVGLLNVGLNVVLIPRYGYLGAGVATAISYGLLNLLYSVHLYRETGIHPISNGLIRPAIVAGLILLFGLWASRAVRPTTVSGLVLLLGLVFATYGVTVLRFAGLQEEELMLVLSFEDRYGIDLGPLKRLAKFLMD